MSDGNGALFLLGGLGLGAAVVGAIIVRNRAAKAEADAASKGSICASVLQPLGRLVNFDIPPGACSTIDSIAGGVIDAIKPTDWDALDADNRRLNGDVLDAVQEDMRRAAGNKLAGANAGTAVKGSASTYKNGCQPFNGAPGWSKCKPGTHDMLAVSGGDTHAPVFQGDAKSYPIDRASMFRGKRGDPFSGAGLAPGGAKWSGNMYIAGKRAVPCEGKSTMTREDLNTSGPQAVLYCSTSTGPSGGYRAPGGGTITTSTGTITTTTRGELPAGTVVRDHK